MSHPRQKQPLAERENEQSLLTLSKFNQENEALHQSNRQKQQLIDALSSEANALQLENQELKEKLRVLRAKVRSLQSQKAKNELERRETEFYKEVLAAKQAEVQSLRAELGKLCRVQPTQSHEECVQERERLKAILDENEHQILELISAVQEKDKQLMRARASEDGEELRGRVAQLQLELVEKERIGIQLLGELGQKSRELEEESNNVKQIMQVYELAKTEIAQLRRRLELGSRQRQ